MKRPARWFGMFTLGIALARPALVGAQVITPANLVGTWVRTLMQGGWLDSQAVAQEILTLRADSTWTTQGKLIGDGKGGHTQKGTWRLSTDSLLFVTISDTAINGKTHWPRNPQKV